MKKHVKTAIATFFSFLVISNSAFSFSGQGEPQTALPAAGYGELDFEAPKAGSYKLPVLGYAQNAKAVDTDDKSVRFHELFRGKYTLLNFMYTRCDDINGCPLSHVVFDRIKNRAAKDPLLAENLQMFSMSFDPEHDTPEVLKEMELGVHDHLMDHGDNSGHMEMGHDGHEGHHMPDNSAQNEVTWKYLTTHSYDELAPVLDAYNQSVIPKTDSDGKETGKFSHVLRVFLIDPELRIRNIYSVSFLHPDIIINDLKTLLMEYGVKANQTSDKQKDDIRIGARDSKEGYESKEYVTNSLSLQSRKGKETDLLRFVKNPPLGLPAVPQPEDNPITEDKIKLGKKLFFDRRLSLNDTQSCAMCHIPEQGFTSHELMTAIGFEGRSVRRNAPTIYNTAYLTKLFLDGRETSLEHQVWQPMLARNEMANPSFGAVIEKVKKLKDYNGLFEAAFDGQKASLMNIAKAISTYERTLVSGNSKFDRWYFNNEKNAMSESAIRGFKLFTGKAQCMSCHTIAKDHALFTDNGLHNTGIGWQRAMKKDSDTEKVQVAPGRYLNVRKEIIKSVGNEPEGDIGRYEITQNPDDRWKYRTPTLRNIALTAPYMHDGSLASLEDVVEFYNKGGFKNETQDPLIHPLNLTRSEMNDLVAFLKSLNGDNVAEIISDSFATPIGDHSNEHQDTP
ncbi:cytochrome c peroxidase [Methylophaga sulfidovorans]|uniref:Methylamine utilization protein MauG n=1 Tax=Methylophaga sulfidovorans TaxID=45496 RepID=A0A1I3UA13_9GAMM|nr:cytochrome c peroxidase [Methylophaga sulfidovorans]SFJ79745.1 Cytochrome c peroxidase [Methylophaga sulfidovorans]